MAEIAVSRHVERQVLEFVAIPLLLQIEIIKRKEKIEITQTELLAARNHNKFTKG